MWRKRKGDDNVHNVVFDIGRSSNIVVVVVVALHFVEQDNAYSKHPSPKCIAVYNRMEFHTLSVYINQPAAQLYSSRTHTHTNTHNWNHTLYWILYFEGKSNKCDEIHLCTSHSLSLCISVWRSLMHQREKHIFTTIRTTKTTKTMESKMNRHLSQIVQNSVQTFQLIFFHFHFHFDLFFSQYLALIFWLLYSRNAIETFSCSVMLRCDRSLALHSHTNWVWCPGYAFALQMIIIIWMIILTTTTNIKMCTKHAQTHDHSAVVSVSMDTQSIHNNNIRFQRRCRWYEDDKTHYKIIVGCEFVET